MILYSRELSAAGVPHAFCPGTGVGGEAVRLQPSPRQPITAWVAPEQVHGVRVVHVTRLGGRPADGVWSDAAGVAVGVRTADCVPLLLAAPEHGRVAALHAGWRGIAGGIVERFLGRQARVGVAPQAWIVAMGPAAGGQRYEVGPEVAAALGLPARRGFVDLRALLSERLRALGISQIECVGPCTITAGPPWASYRREGSAAGRNWAWISAQN